MREQLREGVRLRLTVVYIAASHSSLNKALNDYEERLADVVNLYNVSSHCVDLM